MWIFGHFLKRVNLDNNLIFILNVVATCWQAIKISARTLRRRGKGENTNFETGIWSRKRGTQSSFLLWPWGQMISVLTNTFLWNSDCTALVLQEVIAWRNFLFALPVPKAAQSWNACLLTGVWTPVPFQGEAQERQDGTVILLVPWVTSSGRVLVIPWPLQMHGWSSVNGQKLWTHSLHLLPFWFSGNPNAEMLSGGQKKLQVLLLWK